MSTGRLLLAITQRTLASHCKVHRDCLDQDWCSFLGACRADIIPLATLTPDPTLLIDRLCPDGLILSGGNNVPGSGGGDLAPRRDALETELLRSCVATGRPVLGVCRGMQMINVFFGGRVRPVKGHAGGSHVLTRAVGQILPHPETMEVNSYHDFGIAPEDLGAGLVPLYLDVNGMVEAIAHTSAPVVGIMWHPERTHPPHAGDILMVRHLFGEKPWRSAAS